MLGSEPLSLFPQLWAMRGWFALLGLQGALFWDIFDPLLNYLRGKPYNYVSKSNLLDLFFHRFKNPWKSQLIIKAAVTILTLTLKILT